MIYQWPGSTSQVAVGARRVTTFSGLAAMASFSGRPKSNSLLQSQVGVQDTMCAWRLTRKATPLPPIIRATQGWCMRRSSTATASCFGAPASRSMMTQPTAGIRPLLSRMPPRVGYTWPGTTNAARIKMSMLRSWTMMDVGCGSVTYGSQNRTPGFCPTASQVL